MKVDPRATTSFFLDSNQVEHLLSESNDSSLTPSGHQYRWAQTGDINAFFGLMLDNIAGLLLMVGLLTGFGFPADFAVSRMVPGTALGVLVGDLAFFYFAFRLARQTGRTDVTAMPLGLDTPSTFGIVLVRVGSIVSTGTGDGTDRDGGRLSNLAYRDLVHCVERIVEIRTFTVQRMGSPRRAPRGLVRFAGGNRAGVDQFSAADGDSRASAAGNVGVGDRAVDFGCADSTAGKNAWEPWER